jgi:P pilus assembly protein, pilin FimA
MKKILLFLSLVLSYYTVAAPQQTVAIKVSILHPTCTVNDGRSIEINFGEDIYAAFIDGVKYTKPVIFSLKCHSYTTTAMRLRLTGSVSDFDNTLLATTSHNLGIRFLQGSGATPLPVNHWVSFNYPTLPKLQVVPVRHQQSVLKAGDFSSAATLVVEFR